MSSTDHLTAGKPQLRTFGIGFFVILSLIGAVSWWRSSANAAYVLWGAAVAFGAAGTFAPAILVPIYKPWMVFAEKLAWLNTRLLLSVTFYLVITPIGLVMRLFGSDPMARRKGSGSYWVKPPGSVRGTKHFKNQF